MKKPLVLLPVFALFAIACNQTSKKDHQIINVNKAETAPKIDGKANDECWKNDTWLALDQRWIGGPYSEDDFKGRYKLSWNEEALYLLVEIEDDTLFDQNEDPFKFWWDDDCVEVFVDEDNSGGEHQYNYNAFAYHVSLSGDVIDFGPNEQAHNFKDHVISKRVTQGNTSVWELQVYLYDDMFKDDSKNTPVKLHTGKKTGFALAYCDNDHSKTRENFIGSVFVEGEDKNRGWIDAGIFGTLVLEDWTMDD